MSGRTGMRSGTDPEEDGQVWGILACIAVPGVILLTILICTIKEKLWN